MPLWDPSYLEALQGRKRNRKTARDQVQMRMDLLERHVSNEWEKAVDLAAVAGIPEHSATKLLHKLYCQGRIECQKREWEDTKHRERCYYVYRLRKQVKINLLNSVFGAKVPEVDMSLANVRRHVLEED